MSGYLFFLPFFHKSSFWGFSAAEVTLKDCSKGEAHCSASVRAVCPGPLWMPSHSCLSDRPRPFKAPEGLGAQCAVFVFVQFLGGWAWRECWMRIFGQTKECSCKNLCVPGLLL